MDINIRKFHLIIISVLLIQLIIGIEPVYSQRISPYEEFDKYSKLYPNESGVIVNSWREYNISVVQDSISIQMEEYQELLILSNPSGWIKNHAYTSSFREVTKIEAYTLVPGKKKYKRNEVDEFKKSFDKNTFVFYDDTQVINFSYPEVCKGCKIVKKLKYELKNPHLLGQFFFSSYIPTINVKVRIVIDDNISIKHGLFNKELANIQFSSSKLDDGKTEYVYASKDLDKIESEEKSPSFNYLSPSLYLTICKYNTGGKDISIMSSLEDLHNWYSEFIHKQKIDESIVALAEKIIEGEDDDFEKIKKIFYWVQSNVKYIAFEEGMRGFIPHQADYVLQKRYGDCKDMSSLLVGLLKSQGLAANYTWIGTRDLPYKYSKTPSPIIDNHMIATVQHEGKTLFLDATGSYSPIGFPTSMIQGKESLISINNEPRIVEVPVVPKEHNLMVDTSFLTIDNGIVMGRASLQLTGLVKVANTYKLINKNKDGEENYLKRLLSKGSNKFFLDEYKIFNVENLDKPIQVNYNFRIEDYYKSIGDDIYINLCLDKSLANELIIDRSIPIENDFKYILKTITVLKLPENYAVSYLPENSSLDSDNFGYSINYERIGNRLYTTKEIYVDYLLMYPKDFDEWNTALKEYAQAVRTTVVLTKEQ